MVIDHADRLHESITNRGPDEPKTVRAQIGRKGVRDAGAGRDAPRRSPAVLDGPTVHETPDVTVQAPMAGLEFERGPRVLDRRLDLEPVADDAGVFHQPVDLARAIARHALGVKTVERPSVVLALGEDGRPGQPGLGAL